MTNPSANVQELQSCFVVGMPLFALIDPMLGEPIPLRGGSAVEGVQALREATWKRPIMRIELPQQTPLLPHLHPYLVAVSGPTDPWLQTTLDVALDEHQQAQSGGLAGVGSAAHRIGGWLQTGQSTEQLAQSLQKLVALRVAAFRPSTYLRALDRRVLALLRHVIGDARLMAALPGVQTWAYLDAKGQLAKLRRPAQELSPQNEFGQHASAQPLAFSDLEWLYLKRGDKVHRALAMALGDGSLPSLNACTIAQLLERALQGVPATNPAARRWPARFASDTDHCVWAALSLFHAPLLEPETLPADIQQLLRGETQASPPESLHQMAAQVVQHLQRHVSNTAPNNNESPL